MIAFTGYSDDVVLSGTCKSDLDEYYSNYYLLEDGTIIHANYGQNGWTFTCDNPDHILIDAVDPNDEGLDHDDERIPAWLDPSGCSPVLIINTDARIIAWSDDPFPEGAKNDIPFLKLITAMNKVMNWDADDGLGVDDLKTALNKANLRIEAKEVVL
jgi:hypothetical protein